MRLGSQGDMVKNIDIKRGVVNEGGNVADSAISEFASYIEEG